jgi:tetratricopeptide (TPR) repeat protein
MILKIKISKVLVFVFMLLLVCFAAFSQNKKIDSLKNIVETGTKDTSMVLSLNLLSKEFLNNDELDKVIEYSNKAIILANELDFKRGKGYAQKNIGLAAYYQGDYVAVLDFWTQSLETFESIPDTLGIANLVSNLGVIYYDQGSHDKALEYYFKSLRISEKLNNPIRITTSLVNIGGVYTQMQDYDKALNFYQQIEQYLPNLNDPQIEYHSEALTYYKEALLINKDTPAYAHNLTMIGKEEFKLGNTEKAIEHLNLAYETAKNSDLSLDEVQILLALGDLHQQKDLTKALKAYQEGEVLALNMETSEELRDIYKGMSQTYESKGDFKKGSGI